METQAINRLTEILQAKKVPNKERKIIIESFKKMIEASKDEPDKESFWLYLLDCLNSLSKYLKKFQVININDKNIYAFYFRQNIKPISINQGNIEKLENGKWKISRENSGHYDTIMGLTSGVLRKSNNTTTILDTDNIESTICHVLFHIGSKNTFFVLDNYLFHEIMMKTLKEGYAERYSCNIDKKDILSNTLMVYENYIDYRGIYKMENYFYSRLSFLLGTDFIINWKNNTDSKQDFMKLANEIIDSKYGHGTFERMYLNMIIAFNDDLEKIVKKNNSLHSKRKNEINDICQVEHSILNEFLNGTTNETRAIHNFETVFITCLILEAENTDDLERLEILKKSCEYYRKYCPFFADLS
jgi:hypothetical protein